MNYFQFQTPFHRLDNHEDERRVQECSIYASCFCYDLHNFLGNTLQLGESILHPF